MTKSQTPTGAEDLTPREMLAVLAASSDDIAAQLGAVHQRIAASAAAVAEVAKAEAELRSHLFEEALGSVDATGQRDALVARVKEARASMADAADLETERRRLEDEARGIDSQRKARMIECVWGEAYALAAEYQEHSRKALACESALQGLGRWAAVIAQDGGLAAAIGRLTLPHPDPVKGAVIHEMLKADLANYADAWFSFPGAVSQTNGQAEPPAFPTASDQ
jgi:hypothetical protein